jgi:hypothetical protein
LRALWEITSDCVKIEQMVMGEHNRRLGLAVDAQTRSNDLVSGRPDSAGIIHAESMKGAFTAGMLSQFAKTAAPTKASVKETEAKLSAYMTVLVWIANEALPELGRHRAEALRHRIEALRSR